MQIKYILLVLCLALLIRSQDLETCQQTCYDNFCDEEGLDCDTPLDEISDSLMSFEEQECVDYLYTVGDENSTDDQIKEGFLACMRAHASQYAGAYTYQGQFFGCFTDCIEENPQGFSFDMDMEMDESQVCMLECTQTSDNCQLNSDCAEEYISHDKIIIEMTINNDIQSCDKFMRQEGSPNLSFGEYNGLLKGCFNEISTLITAENNQNADTYPDDLADVLTCFIECSDDYGFHHEDVHKANQSNDEEDCFNDYCLHEFDICIYTCEKECFDNDCLGDEYLSMIGSEECKTYIQDKLELYNSDDIPVVDQDFLDKFEACNQSYEEQFSNNQDILDFIQCQRECKVKPGRKNDDDDGENGSILAIGLAIFLTLIIF